MRLVADKGSRPVVRPSSAAAPALRPRRPGDLPPLEGGKAVAFHRLEERFASLVAQNLADEIAESMHVLAQS